jgi:hypothetical protein
LSYLMPGVIILQQNTWDAYIIHTCMHLSAFHSSSTPRVRSAWEWNWDNSRWTSWHQNNFVIISRYGRHVGGTVYYLWSITHFKNKAVAFDQRPWPLHNRHTRTDNLSFGKWPLHIQ